MLAGHSPPPSQNTLYKYVTSCINKYNVDINLIIKTDYNSDSQGHMKEVWKINKLILKRLTNLILFDILYT